MAVDFAIELPLVRPGRPRYPVLVHKAAALLHASFRPRLATTPLRFANPHFSRFLIECCGELTPPIPQPTPVIGHDFSPAAAGRVVRGDHETWMFSCGPRVQNAALSRAAQAVRKTSV